MSPLRRIAERLRSELRPRGAAVSLPREAGACVELAVEWRGRVLGVYLYPGRFSEAVVAKLSPVLCGCERALSCPYGLLVVAEEEALADAIHSKLDRLLAISRFVEEEGVELY